MSHSWPRWANVFVEYPVRASQLLLRLTEWQEVKSALIPWQNTTISHWGRVTYICVDNLTIIGSDNGLAPGRRQAIIRTNAGILLFGPLGKNFNEFLIEILTFSFKKMCLKVLSAKWRPYCLGLNVIYARPWIWWSVHMNLLTGKLIAFANNHCVENDCHILFITLTAREK